jgi:hypothetical protein
MHDVATGAEFAVNEHREHSSGYLPLQRLRDVDNPFDAWVQWLLRNQEQQVIVLLGKLWGSHYSKGPPGVLSALWCAATKVRITSVPSNCIFIKTESVRNYQSNK